MIRKNLNLKFCNVQLSFRKLNCTLQNNKIKENYIKWKEIYRSLR